MKLSEKYKGIRSSLPKSTDRRFCISLCFFKNESDENNSDVCQFNLKNFIKAHDPQLYAFLVDAMDDVKIANIRIYMGDPDEELEDAIEKYRAKTNEETIGYVLFNRTAKLKPDDNLPQSDEERDMLAGEFKPTPKLEQLFKYIETNYIVSSQLKD